MTSAIETLKTWITESDNIVFFGGAGVSTESGIPDFRSTDGLYHQKFDYPPETILSATTARNAANSIRPNTSVTARASPAAPAAGGSSRTWCSTRKASTRP